MDPATLSFAYGENVFGPTPEFRRLDAIRASLLDPACEGPDPVYGIAMDVGERAHRDELVKRQLLVGVVAYAAGQLGEEPVRSQGHVHARAPHSGWSPPELFEIWQGTAIVYMQERCEDDPGRCFAVVARPGEHVIVPPGWGHFVANADTESPMVFAALCDRQYAFEYEAVRKRHGLAWFALCRGGGFTWKANPSYGASTLSVGRPRAYSEFNVTEDAPLYQQFVRSPEALQWVSEPGRMLDRWRDFNPIDESDEVYCSRT